jgi:hypothetical protein
MKFVVIYKNCPEKQILSKLRSGIKNINKLNHINNEMSEL